MAIAEARGTHDLVLLDVDNGPGYLVHDGNADVYGREFLARCRDVLTPSRACWSSGRPPAPPSCSPRCEDVFGAAEERSYDVLLQDRPEEYFLYVARRSTPEPPPA